MISVSSKNFTVGYGTDMSQTLLNVSGLVQCIVQLTLTMRMCVLFVVLPILSLMTGNGFWEGAPNDNLFTFRPDMRYFSWAPADCALLTFIDDKTIDNAWKPWRESFWSQRFYDGELKVFVTDMVVLEGLESNRDSNIEQVIVSLSAFSSSPISFTIHRSGRKFGLWPKNVKCERPLSFLPFPLADVKSYEMKGDSPRSFGPSD
jgi:hypothetical protein